MSNLRRDVPATQGNAPVSGWTVTSQQETFEQSPAGQIVRGRRVYFQLASGPTGSVFVPDAQYTPDNVRAAVAQAAAVLAQVQGLSG